MGAINATNFIPEIWEDSVMRVYEDNLVAMKVVWDKSSKISKFGDTIHFNGVADPTVTGGYDGSLSYETLSDSQISLLVNQRNTYAFIVDDVEEAMANVDLKGSQAARAGYTLAKACDTYVFGSNIYGDAGNTINDDTCDTSTILSAISGASRLLDEASVPATEKWIAVSPAIKEKMELAGVKFSINMGTNKKGGLQWADYRDLKVFVTNNLHSTGSTGTEKFWALAGSARAIGFAQKLMETRALQDTARFGTYMSGLQVFGAKVLFPNELVLLTLTMAAETAI